MKTPEGKVAAVAEHVMRDDLEQAAADRGERRMSSCVVDEVVQSLAAREWRREERERKGREGNRKRRQEQFEESCQGNEIEGSVVPASGNGRERGAAG